MAVLRSGVRPDDGHMSIGLCTPVVAQLDCNGRCDHRSICAGAGCDVKQTVATQTRAIGVTAHLIPRAVSSKPHSWASSESLDSDGSGRSSRGWLVDCVQETAAYPELIPAPGAVSRVCGASPNPTCQTPVC